VTFKWQMALVSVCSLYVLAWMVFVFLSFSNTPLYMHQLLCYITASLDTCYSFLLARKFYYNYNKLAITAMQLPSVLWHCWLGDMKGICPVKTKSWGAGVVMCLGQAADLHMAQLMPLPLTISCFSKIQIGFIFLVPAHPGSPRQRAIKQGVLLLYYSNAECNTYYTY